MDEDGQIFYGSMMTMREMLNFLGIWNIVKYLKKDERKKYFMKIDEMVKYVMVLV